MRQKALSSAVLCLALAAALSAASKKRLEPELLVSPFLGPEYAQWLVGAVGWIATEQERRQYLELERDSAAQDFIEAFWQQGSQDRSRSRALFEQRASEADKKFSEGAFPGRRTDRGTIWILYGPPEDTRYEDGRHVLDPPVELWQYPKKRQTGLDGERPQRIYRFARQGDLIRFFDGLQDDDPRLRRQRRLSDPSFRPPR